MRWKNKIRYVKFEVIRLEIYFVCKVKGICWIRDKKGVKDEIL